MNEINRSLMLVTPRQPYLDWARGNDPSFSTLTLDMLGEDPTAYLVPSIETRTLERGHWREIFEHELGAWTTKRAAWPRSRTFTMFCGWFDIRFASLVLDVTADQLVASLHDERFLFAISKKRGHASP